MLGLRSLARFGLVAGVGALMIGAVACGSDDDDNGTATPAATATQAAATGATGPTGTAETIEIVAVDYEFENLPDRVSVGTTFTLKNESDEELHELVALRLPQNETRPVSEILQLPEAELVAMFESGPPAMVLVAMPNEDGMPVVGDGTFTEAGRYAILCFVPVGADPQAFMDAAEDSDGPPDVEGGPPHAFEGMFGEVIVE